MRPTSCEIDLDAIEQNVRALSALVSPTPLCAVVKANGYGHGAVPVAKRALDAGVSWLAVALVEEGVELREAGIDAPILVLSEPHPSAMDTVVSNRLTASLYSLGGIAAIAEAAAAATEPIEVHVCIDTGMRRVGAEPGLLAEIVERIGRYPQLSLTSVWTHCPVADEPDNPFTDDQLGVFSRAIDSLAHDVETHVGNSAVAITRPEREAMMVRCGIAMYGIDPDVALTGRVQLAPAMSVRSEVSFVKTVEAGEGIGYGHRYTTAETTTIATVPIGYADGVRRDLGLCGGEVLIGGQRHPIRGVVTMDQLMVDVGNAGVAVGDEVIVIGSQGDQEITAADVADLLGTIPYEVVCAVSSRMPRTY